MYDQHRKVLIDLKQRYEASINSGDVERIMTDGKAYYNTLRNGEMTNDDRESLQNVLLLVRSNTPQ